MTHHRCDSELLEISLQGLPYSDFDRTGHWAPWKVLKCVEAAIDISSVGLKGDERHISYVIHMILILHEHLHKDVRYYSQNFPKLQVALCNVGNSSFKHHVNVVNSLDGQQYAECYIKSVVVEKDTGKVAAVPQWYTQKNKVEVKGQQQICDRLDLRQFPSLPVNVYTMTSKIRPSDIDIMGHTNNSVYIMLCMDCATSAALEGRYKHYNTDMCCYPVLEVDIQYLGQSRVNDTVTIATWQEEKDIQRINFIISRNDINITTAMFVFGLNTLENVKEWA